MVWGNHFPIVAGFPWETLASSLAFKDPGAEFPTVDQMVYRTRVLNPDFPRHYLHLNKVASSKACEIMVSWTDSFCGLKRGAATFFRVARVVTEQGLEFLPEQFPVNELVQFVNALGLAGNCLLVVKHAEEVGIFPWVAIFHVCTLIIAPKM